MDGASILPVLALDVQPGDQILDMCSAPGGKALTILQTLHPKLLVCNDLSLSRVNRIHKVMGQFLYDYENNWKGMLSVQQYNGAYITDTDVYDKVCPKTQLKFLNFKYRLSSTHLVPMTGYLSPKMTTTYSDKTE